MLKERTKLFKIMKSKLLISFILSFLFTKNAIAEPCYEIYRTPWVGTGHATIFKCEVDGQICVFNIDQGGVSCFPKPKTKR